MEIHNTLRKHRLKQKLTLRKLSEMTSLDHGQICRYEKGKITPSLKSIFKLEKALGIGRGELLR